MNSTSQNTPSDIVTQNWVDKYLPKFCRPYARLARLDGPIGTWLLLLPCWWGLALATAHYPAEPTTPLYYMILFAIGALVMRGAGCTWNDITDRDFDGKVTRTATRPIPAGDVSVKQALVFMALQCLIGLVVLLQFNNYAIIVGVTALILVIAYPFMKRITYWPQAWLGLTFNWGVLVGWIAIVGDISMPALTLYAAGFFWTLGYDTIYAHQDKEDDVLIGVKSTALRLGDGTAKWMVGFYGATIILIGLAAYQVDIEWPFWFVLGLGAIHLLWQVKSLNIDDAQNCSRLFKSNRDFGIVIFIGIVAGAF